MAPGPDKSVGLQRGEALDQNRPPVSMSCKGTYSLDLDHPGRRRAAQDLGGHVRRSLAQPREGFPRHALERRVCGLQCGRHPLHQRPAYGTGEQLRRRPRAPAHGIRGRPRMRGIGPELFGHGLKPSGARRMPSGAQHPHHLERGGVLRPRLALQHHRQA